MTSTHSTQSQSQDVRWSRRRSSPILLATVAVAVLANPNAQTQSQPTLSNPILFVTQVPTVSNFEVASLFANHVATMSEAPRGGDLWIRYPDGTLRNLTKAAGFGVEGMQGANAIAVREPNVHWSGTRAVFSMIVGGTTTQYQHDQFRWQLYEVTGLGRTDTPRIARVPNQPKNYNNISPIYGTNGRIIFTSDKPRVDEPHLYPQRDEYESAPTVTGLWSLDPSSGDTFLLQHSPSGSFSPQIDSFGRVVYARWDHLQRDQQADADRGGAEYGTFNYSDESRTSVPTRSREEIFPEPRPSRTDLLAGTNLLGLAFNSFFAWTINEDGTGEETLNHLGRHEIQNYIVPSIDDDPNLQYLAVGSEGSKRNSIQNFTQVKEDPTTPGVYYGVNPPEFYTHSAGQIVKLNAPLSLNPDLTAVTYVTHPDTRIPTDAPGPNHSGLYRNPLPLSDGNVVVAHTSETREDANMGTVTRPRSRHAFRLKLLQEQGGVSVAGPALTSGITKSLTYWSPDLLVTYNGPLWELDPVEVRSRPVPRRDQEPLAAPIQRVLAQQSVSLDSLQRYLRDNDLALLVSNNVTTRDRADKQQPFNLRVTGTNTQTTGSPGKLYDVSHLQIFQADLVRGLGGVESPKAGRRVLARIMHDDNGANPRPTGAPAGAVELAADGSVAAFVPARRALTWQLTSFKGEPVVRERYWISFQPGEVRVCTSCHGINSADQAGQPPPANEPEALRQLLKRWRDRGFPR